MGDSGVNVLLHNLVTTLMTRDMCYLCDLASDEADSHAVVPMAQEIPVTNGRVYRGPDQEDCNVMTDYSELTLSTLDK